MAVCGRPKREGRREESGFGEASGIKWKGRGDGEGGRGGRRRGEGGKEEGGKRKRLMKEENEERMGEA